MTARYINLHFTLLTYFTPLPPRKIYSCPRPQPVPAPFAAFCPHPRPVTVLFVPIPTPLPQSRANKNTPFPGVEKTMDMRIFIHHKKW